MNLHRFRSASTRPIAALLLFAGVGLAQTVEVTHSVPSGRVSGIDDGRFVTKNARVSRPPAIPTSRVAPTTVPAHTGTALSTPPIGAVDSRKNGIGWSEWISAGLSSFAGALAGAGIVFFLQTRKEEKERREGQINALRRIQFALVGRLNILSLIWNQWLQPAKASHDGHWAALQPPAGIVPPEPFPLERIEFVLINDPNLFGTLRVNEEAFQGFLDTVRRYSTSREEASRTIEKTDSRVVEGFKQAELEKSAGPRLHYWLSALAKALYERCPTIQAELTSTFDRVAGYIKDEYRETPLRIASEDASQGTKGTSPGRGNPRTQSTSRPSDPP